MGHGARLVACTIVASKDSGLMAHPFDVQLNELAQFSDTQKPSVTRLVYGKQDVAARK